MDLIDFIIRFETGELSARQIVEFMAGLAGDNATLGAISGGRKMFEALVENEYITEQGDILVDLEELDE